jgi:hypothetical protein
MNFMLSNALSFSGDLYGMAAAFFLYYAKTQAAHSSYAENPGQMSYGQLQYRHH